MKNKLCIQCRNLNRDSHGDHLYLMKDGITWTCSKDIHPPYFERDGEAISSVKTQRSTMDIQGIIELPFSGNKDRDICKETHEYFKIRTEFNESNGSVAVVYYPETHKGKLMGFKGRKMPKSFFTVSGGVVGVPDFFGQHCCPATGKRLLITGGEEDCMAAYEMLKERYPEYAPAVVSVPRGEASSMATFSENLEFLKGFDEIILGMDMDEAGQKAIAIYAPVIGEKVRVMTISEKDASEMKVKGKAQEWINAYYKAREWRPSNIVKVGDILEDAIQPVPWGLTYPFSQLTHLTYGLKKSGEIIGIGGAPGGGKSTLVRQIQQHLMFVHNEKIGIFDIEEKAKGSLKLLIGGIMNKPIHKPDCAYDMEEARRIGLQLEGKAEFYDGLTEDWEEVESNIRYFASKGVKVFFIDPLSALVEHLSASEGNQELGKIMRSMRRFRQEQGLTFFHANHLNNPPGGKDHGAGGTVYGSQFSGSRAQWKYSTALWGLSRDQLAETEEERNVCKLTIIKDRLGGNTGSIDLYYDSTTGQLHDFNAGGDSF